MKNRASAAIIVILLLTGCTCVLHKTGECENKKYGPIAIRLSEFSRQVVYYYKDKEQPIPANFDGKEFVSLLRKLPPDQVSQKDLDSMNSKFKIFARKVDSGLSVMLCDENNDKLMEDFASPPGSKCRFDLNSVEIKSWSKNIPCSFEEHWSQYCK